MYAKPFEKNNFTTALDAIDDTFDHYVTYDNGDDINKKSVDTFLNKIGGYLYINSLPPVDQEIYHVCNSCRAHFDYWNPQKGKAYVEEYVRVLRDYGWDELQILNDLKNELLKESNKKKNWSERRDFIVKWTSDIQGWSNDKREVQDESGKLCIPDEHMNRNEDISIYYANSHYVTFKYLYETSGFSNPQRWRRVFKYLDDALYRFLIDQRDEFTSKKGITLGKPIADVMEAYIDGNHMLHLMLEDDEDYGAGNENMPTGVKSYFFDELFVTILRDMFNYFYLPSPTTTFGQA